MAFIGGYVGFPRLILTRFICFELSPFVIKDIIAMVLVVCYPLGGKEPVSNASSALCFTFLGISG